MAGIYQEGFGAMNSGGTGRPSSYPEYTMEPTFRQDKLTQEHNVKVERDWWCAENFLALGVREWLRGTCGAEVAEKVHKVEIEPNKFTNGRALVVIFKTTHERCALHFTMPLTMPLVDDLIMDEQVPQFDDLTTEDILYLKAVCG